MNPYMVKKNVVVAITAFVICVLAKAGLASPVRLGYLDNPGSALCKTAAGKGHFKEEGVQVELVKFASTDSGLAALEKGAIDVGAFAVGDTLRAIAKGKGFRIIAGGGTFQSDNPLTELDDSQQAEIESRGIVVLISPSWPNSEKGTIIQLTAALIRAYRTDQQYFQTVSSLPASRTKQVVHFDPNPDYWRLERIWRSLGLQEPNMKRDFLAIHVYEEIYCDALDRHLLGDIDPVLQQLFSKAVCTPNCCPASAAKL
jgi:hypothetical protein